MSDTTAVVTDLHLEPDNADTLLESLEETLTDISCYDPDLLVVLGDLVHGSDAKRDLALVKRLISRLDETGIPVHYLPGNHDVVTLEKVTFTDTVGNERWSVDEETERCFLDSAASHLGKSRGEVNTAQLGALRDQLPGMEQALLFVHHPVHYHDIRDNRWFSEHPEEAFCGNKRAVTEVLRPDSVGAVLNGHLHEFAVTEYRDITHFSIDAFNKTVDPDGTTGAFAIVERGEQVQVTHVSGDRTEHEVRLPG